MIYRLSKLVIPLFTVVSIVLAGYMAEMVDIYESEEAREEKPTCQTSVQDELPALVDNNVEIVETEYPDNEAPLPYDETDHEILSIIIYQEAGGDACSDETRRMVGSVFLNRVNSPLFPNTYEEVATQPRQYATLSVTGVKWPDRAQLPQEAHAVQRAKDIAEELMLSGSILPPNVIWQAEFVQGDGIYCYQDETYFCYSEVN